MLCKHLIRHKRTIFAQPLPLSSVQFPPDKPADFSQATLSIIDIAQLLLTRSTWESLSPQI
jgi:hypothetical protein